MEYFFFEREISCARVYNCSEYDHIGSFDHYSLVGFRRPKNGEGSNSVCNYCQVFGGRISEFTKLFIVVFRKENTIDFMRV